MMQRVARVFKRQLSYLFCCGYMFAFVVFVLSFSVLKSRDWL